MIGSPRFAPWPLVEFSERRPCKPQASIGVPGHPDYLDMGRWWENKRGTVLERGFVSNSRFASNATEQVIPRTDRSKQRKARAK
jgi:hypothetical protein